MSWTTDTELALPRIALGIPIGDSNTQTPDSTNGVPVPPWVVEAKMQGHIYGIHLGNSLSQSLSANKFGVGRSIHVDLQSDMDGLPPWLGGSGGGDAVIRTPPSYYGFLPQPGVELAMTVAMLLTVNVDFRTQDSAHVVLEQYGASGGRVAETVITTIPASTDTGGKWWSWNASQTITKLSTARYWRIAIYFNGGTSAGTMGIDFIGLGWIPGAVVGSQSFADHYFRGDAEYQQRIQDLSPRDSYTSFRTALAGGVKAFRFSLAFFRTPQAWYEDLLFFWQAQNGHPTGSDRLVPGTASDLGGRPWPLLVELRRPGLKQACYCQMPDKPLGLDIDYTTDAVDEEIEWSGTVMLEEVIF